MYMAFLILIPVSLGLGLLGLGAFLWTMKADQYDDLDGAAVRVLYDDPDDKPKHVTLTKRQHASQSEHDDAHPAPSR